MPLALLVARGATGRLGANPVETITHATGAFSLRFLLASLAVTPLARLLRWSALRPYRRSLGLLCFGYASLHVLTFFVLDLGLDFGALGEEVRERPYVTLGFTAYLCLVPLAVTSTRGWQRRLGRRWVALHRLAYLAAVLAVLHFAWLVKADLLEPAVLGAALLALLAGRRVARAR